MNTLIIICIPLGLLFAGGVVGYQMSYEDFDLSEKVGAANWSKHDQRIVANMDFFQRAGIATLFAFAVLVVVRVGLSIVKSHSKAGAGTGQ